MGSIIILAGKASLFEGVWVVLTLGLLFVYKWIKRKTQLFNQRKTSSLLNIKDYYDKPLDKRDNFLLEMLYQDHLGRSVSYKEVEFFLNRENAIRDLGWYLSGRRFLRLCSYSGQVLIKDKGSLLNKERKYLGLYFLTGFISLFMVLGAYKVFSMFGVAIIAPWALSCILLLSLAGLYMSEFLAAESAKGLLKELNP